MRHIRPVSVPRAAQAPNIQQLAFLLDVMIAVLNLVTRFKGPN